MNAADIAASLEARYREIAAGPMSGLPICNPRLDVATIGFRLFGGDVVGLVVTPWFINVVAVPSRPDSARAGTTRRLALPAGVIELIVGELEGFGRLDAASLFSPCHEFADRAAAVEAAGSAARALFTAPQVDRRALLRGRLTSAEA